MNIHSVMLLTLLSPLSTCPAVIPVPHHSHHLTLLTNLLICFPFLSVALQYTLYTGPFPLTSTARLFSLFFFFFFFFVARALQPFVLACLVTTGCCYYVLPRDALAQEMFLVI